MSKLKQENMLSFYFNRSLQLEDLFLKKCELPKKMIQDKILEQMMKDFKKNSREHIKDLSDKMNRLGIQ